MIATHLLPDHVDLVRAMLAEGERLAGKLERQVAEIADILAVCLRCGCDRRDCGCER